MITIDWKVVTPYLLLIAAGVFIGILITNNRDLKSSRDTLKSERDEAYLSLAAKDSTILTLQDTIAAHDSILVRVTKSIEKLIEEENQITDKYEDLYLNPDSADWAKLDSLASIILHR